MEFNDVLSLWTSVSFLFSSSICWQRTSSLRRCHKLQYLLEAGPLGVFAPFVQSGEMLKTYFCVY